MNKVTIVLITVVMAIGFISLLSFLNIKNIDGSQIRTILGTILMFVVTRAIWKIPSKDYDNGTHPSGKVN